MTKSFATARVIAAAAILAAILAQLIRSLDTWNAAQYRSIPTAVVNFFSFFTIDSNVLSVVALLCGAWFLFRGNTAGPVWYQTFLACVVTYMATTGLVYNTILRGIELPQGTTVAWSNEILHVYGPLYLVLDWLFAPGRRRLSWRVIWTVVAFPIIWLIYTMVRGPLVHNEATGEPFWYPYPFLNPHQHEGGYLTVSLYGLGIAVAIVAVAFSVMAVTRRQPQGERAFSSTTHG